MEPTDLFQVRTRDYTRGIYLFLINTLLLILNSTTIEIRSLKAASDEGRPRGRATVPLPSRIRGLSPLG